MISWEEYVKANILEFRKRYGKFSKEIKKIIKEDKLLSLVSLNKPCQVVVIGFRALSTKCFIILHSKKNLDMEIKVLEEIAFDDFSSEVLKKIRLLEPLGSREIGKIYNVVRYVLTEQSEEIAMSWGSFYKSIVFFLKSDPKTWTPHIISDFMQRMMGLRINSLKIKETVGDIRRDAGEIPVTEVRTKITEATERLEEQIKQLDKKLKEEVGGVRQLIGASEKYLDWKAFTTDFEHLKETHIAKDVFDAHIKRIDEKIDKGLQALSTRIEDLKAIKFWSKRTIVDIILAIIATASTTIVTLIVAGILKF